MLHTIPLLVSIVIAKLRRAWLGVAHMLQRLFGFWESKSAQNTNQNADILATLVQDAAGIPETEFDAKLAEFKI